MKGGFFAFFLADNLQHSKVKNVVVTCKSNHYKIRQDFAPR